MRVYEMFMGPLEVSKPWSTRSIAGVKRFLDRAWKISEKVLSEDSPPDSLLELLHKTVKKVSQDTAGLDFNTAIAQMMIFCNGLNREDRLYRQLWEPFTKMLSAYAPHLAEEMWQKLGHQTSIAKEPWPEWDEALATEDVVTIVCQVNGKLRDRLPMPRGTAKEELEKAALGLDRIKKYTSGKSVVKVIVVPDRLVNVVVK